MTTDLDALAEVAHAMADAARAAILPHFRHPDLSTENKLDGGYDPVTQADRAAEEAMREVLQARRPHDGILGEEFGHRPGSSGLTWVLDPIDGTRAFVAGAPTWGILIAVGPDGQPPLLGLIDQPHIGERFVGYGGRAQVAGPRGTSDIRAAGATDLADAILMTTFPEVGTPHDRAAFEAVAARVKLTRYGLDCYAYALVAAGHVDLVIEAGLNSYDIQAPMALIEAAGGIVTDWRGGPAHRGGRVLAAANAQVHRAALDLLGNAP